MNNNQPTGSLAQGEPFYLVIGKLGRPHGINGEITLEVYTDFPERIKRGVVIYAGETRRPLRIRTCRPLNQGLLVAFDQYNDPEAVGELRNEWLYVRADDRPPLPEGEYYHHQMIGLRVIDDLGNLIGKLTQILDYPANDIYVVRPESGPEILLPAIDDVILEISIPHGEIRVHLLPGLLPE